MLDGGLELPTGPTPKRVETVSNLFSLCLFSIVSWVSRANVLAARFREEIDDGCSSRIDQR